MFVNLSACLSLCLDKRTFRATLSAHELQATASASTSEVWWEGKNWKVNNEGQKKKERSREYTQKKGKKD